MIAAPVQCDIDQIPKRSHYVLLERLTVQLTRPRDFFFLFTFYFCLRFALASNDLFGVVEIYPLDGYRRAGRWARRPRSKPSIRNVSSATSNSSSAILYSSGSRFTKASVTTIESRSVRSSVI